MARNLLKDGNRTWNPFGTGTVTRKVGLSRAEELAIINGHWLHKVSVSKLDQARPELTVTAEMAPQEAPVESASESDRWDPVWG